MYITASSIAHDLGVSKTYAYNLMKKMNQELKDKGYITMHGKVNRNYYLERFYGVEEKGEERHGSI